MGVRENRGHLKKGEKRSVTQMTSAVSPIILMDAVYLNLKIMGNQKYFQSKKQVRKS
jgi:hypothetical protein